MLKRKGFTLVELLAVLIVLAIILAIAVPSITGVIRSATKNAFVIDAKMVIKAVDYEKLNDRSFDETSVDKESVASILKLSNENYESVRITIEDETLILTIVGKNKWDGFIACGTYDNMQVVESTTDCSNDLIPPVITVLGDNPANIFVEQPYSDAGATATDNKDGDITSNISVSSNINPSVPGTYTITYTVTDTAGNTTSATRTINVIDNVGPVITFNPTGYGTYDQTRSIIVTLSDAGVVDINSLKYVWTTSTTEPQESEFLTSFTSGGSVDTPSLVTGDYYLWIIASDTSNNTTISRSEVVKLDNTIPVITMNGSSPVSINKGSTYSDAGATASDAHSGVGSVTATGTVNPSIVGTYYIRYNVSDNAGNAAVEVTRTVNVIDVSAPVITILGSNPVNINVGSVYSDEGATALDDVDGDVTSRINTTGTVNPSVPGSYTITYTVRDNANNEAISTRTVNVIDNVLPTIAFGTNGNAVWAKTRSTTVTVSDAHSSVNTSSLKYQWNTSTSTPTEGSFSTSFTNGGTITSPAGVTGGYYLWILAKDTVGNTSIQRTNVFNLDNTAPSVPTSEVRYGSSTGTIRANSDSSWTNQTLWWGNFSASETASGINRYEYSSDCTGTVTGNLSAYYTYSNNSYNICIRAVDNAGNTSAWSSVTYIRADNTAPSVPTSEVRYGSSTGTIRANNNSSWTNQTLWWGNFSAIDATSGVSSYQYSSGCTGTVSGTLGASYTYSTDRNSSFCIQATDNAGNTSAWSSVTYIKVDKTAPVITMNGSSPVGVIQGSTYTDAGATATDAYSGVGSVTATGTVNPSVIGTYYVNYNVSDNAGNAATQVTRTVNVISSTFTFTTAGATGRYGPSQAQINTAYTGTSLAGAVTSSSGIQLWTVPATGTYKIETWGAGGGLRTDWNCSTFGISATGMGTRMIGNFALTAGTQLKILVGQRGSDTVFDSDTFAHFIVGGGGGGTFVTYSNDSPLIVAGGGGGQIFCDNMSGIVWARTDTYGNPASANNAYGGGGGGLNGDGAAGTAISPPAPSAFPLTDINGKAFVNGGAGGANYCVSNVKNCPTYHAGDGGFGGGSGGYFVSYQMCVPGVGCGNSGASVSGSGGGYSGGNGGINGGGGASKSGAGGGGGSYNAGTNQSSTQAFNSGAGRVVITYLGP